MTDLKNVDDIESIKSSIQEIIEEAIEKINEITANAIKELEGLK